MEIKQLSSIESIEKMAMALCSVHCAWPEERWNNPEPCKKCDMAEEAFSYFSTKSKRRMCL